MDADHFDHLTRTLLTRPHRRSLLLGLASGLVATLPLALGHDAADAKKRKKHKKRKHPQAAPPPPPPGPTCSDGVKNGNETDIDCGGPQCPACANGRICATNTDCSSARCGDALGEGTTCRSCTSDGVCNIDANGGCTCDAETGVCLSNPGPLPVQDSCAVCPTGTVCKSSFDGFFCIPLCGA